MISSCHARNYDLMSGAQERAVACGRLPSTRLVPGEITSSFTRTSSASESARMLGCFLQRVVSLVLHARQAGHSSVCGALEETSVCIRQSQRLPQS